MTSVQYNGHYTLTYPDHLDTSTGRTLVAVPGQSYTTAVAPGRNASLPSLPGDGRWGAVFGWAAEKPHEDSPGELADDPPAAPEPAPAASTGESEPDTVPAAGEPAASPESED